MGNPEDSERNAGAIIVGVRTGTVTDEDLDEQLTELAALLKTLDIPVAGRLVQKRAKPDVSSLLGRGKVAELKSLAELKGAGLIVFDQSLTPTQTRNLEKLTCTDVLDRTGVILEIFFRHARSGQAKTQVEIARLEYMLPRLSGAWTHFQRQAGGGVRSRGMGEKQIEIDRRRARQRITRLQRQLEQIARETRNRSKGRAGEFRVALVGYTNSGKTTLMRALTRTHTDGKDELFATLDTSIKIIDPGTRPRILISDTVGFIRNLPHGLVESFRSTLEEVSEADLLLHVVDVSHPGFREQMNTTREVLGEIGAGHVPEMLIFNKTDQVEDEATLRVLKSAYPRCIQVSAHSESDVRQLRERVVRTFRRDMVRGSIVLDQRDRKGISLVHRSCVVLDEDYSEEGQVRFTLEATPAVMARLKNHVNQTVMRSRMENGS